MSLQPSGCLTMRHPFCAHLPLTLESISCSLTSSVQAPLPWELDSSQSGCQQTAGTISPWSGDVELTCKNGCGGQCYSNNFETPSSSLLKQRPERDAMDMQVFIFPTKKGLAA